MTESRGQPRIVRWGLIVVGIVKESILFHVERFRLLIDVRALSRILAPRESQDFDVGFTSYQLCIHTTFGWDMWDRK